MRKISKINKNISGTKSKKKKNTQNYIKINHTKIYNKIRDVISASRE